MKNIFQILLVGIISFPVFAFANDGGIAAIRVHDIRMREYKFEDGTEKEIRRIVKPNFKITFKGGEAAKLQQTLPSEVSVITGMQPEIAGQFNATFKSLGVYNHASADVSAKALTISCNDGSLVPIGETGKFKIVKKPETECTISILGVEDGTTPEDYFGAITEYSPTCHP